jgi:hypothetical protein
VRPGSQDGRLPAGRQLVNGGAGVLSGGGTLDAVDGGGAPSITSYGARITHGGFGGGGGGGTFGAGGIGGGGSFVSPLSPLADLVLVSGFNSGNGYVTINLADPAVPEPSTWAMVLLGFASLGFAGYRRRHKLAGAASV